MFSYFPGWNIINLQFPGFPQLKSPIVATFRDFLLGFIEEYAAKTFRVEDLRHEPQILMDWGIDTGRDQINGTPMT